MKASIYERLTNLQLRQEELSLLLGQSEIIQNQSQFTAFSKEYSDIAPLLKVFSDYQAMVQQHEDALSLLSIDDLELKQCAQEESELTKKKLETLESDLQLLLIPQDPDDRRNIFLEIRAGTGGDEAAIFAGDLARMYMRYAEKQQWQVEIVNESFGEQGGYKEIIIRVMGQAVYSHLKFESGAHRVQRVPLTEAQGRIHTSACTVAVMPEVEDIDEIELNMGDIRVDTYRSSGAGGQHVNKTDSAIRLTHIPTGIVVECQDERSQHKNKARALSVLRAKLLAAERAKQASEQAETRKQLVGSGDRSERIRTYNYPQGRLTDHRINLTLYKLEDVMEGDLKGVIGPLIREHQMDLLSQIGDNH